MRPLSLIGPLQALDRHGRTKRPAGLPTVRAMRGDKVATQVDAVDAAADGAAFEGRIVGLAELLTVLDQGWLRRIENDKVGVGARDEAPLRG